MLARGCKLVRLWSSSSNQKYKPPTVTQWHEALNVDDATDTEDRTPYRDRHIPMRSGDFKSL